MIEIDIKTLQEVERIIDYAFSEPSLLRLALTHSSYANEHNIHSNENLEFFGDSILNVIISEHIYNNYNSNEGTMSILRSKIVSELPLSKAIDNLNLIGYLQCGIGETKNTVKSTGMKADLFEAFVAAIYIDSGNMYEPERFILKNLAFAFSEALGGNTSTKIIPSNCIAKGSKKLKIVRKQKSIIDTLSTQLDEAQKSQPKERSKKSEPFKRNKKEEDKRKKKEVEEQRKAAKKAKDDEIRRKAEEYRRIEEQKKSENDKKQKKSEATKAKKAKKTQPLIDNIHEKNINPQNVKEQEIKDKTTTKQQKKQQAKKPVEDKTDYKSLLMNYAQKNNIPIKFELLNEAGVPHKPIFEIAVFLNGERCGEGAAPRKKLAEQIASKVAYGKIMK